MRSLVSECSSLELFVLPGSNQSAHSSNTNFVKRVTGIELSQTDEGLQVILKTVAGSERLVPLIVPERNSLVIDVLDATLGFSIFNH